MYGTTDGRGAGVNSLIEQAAHSDDRYCQGSADQQRIPIVLGLHFGCICIQPGGYGHQLGDVLCCLGGVLKTPAKAFALAA